jgi:hypothetical protein
MRTSITRQFFITFIPSVIILALIAIISKVLNWEIHELTRDPASSAGISPIIGLLSNLGILLWCAAGSICFFSALTLRKVISRKTIWFLLSSTFLTMYLLFDDLFLFHEYLSESDFWLGEKKLYLILAIIAFVYLFVFKQIILKTRYIFLLLAFGFFGASLFVDAILADYLESFLGSWMYFVEDGFKWLGITFWLNYFVYTSHQLFISCLKKVD